MVDRARASSSNVAVDVVAKKEAVPPEFSAFSSFNEAKTLNEIPMDVDPPLCATIPDDFIEVMDIEMVDSKPLVSASSLTIEPGIADLDLSAVNFLNNCLQFSLSNNYGSSMDICELEDSDSENSISPQDFMDICKPMLEDINMEDLFHPKDPVAFDMSLCDGDADMPDASPLSKPVQFGPKNPYNSQNADDDLSDYTSDSDSELKCPATPTPVGGTPTMLYGDRLLLAPTKGSDKQMKGNCDEDTAANEDAKYTWQHQNMHSPQTRHKPVVQKPTAHALLDTAPHDPYCPAVRIVV